jgi:hypothetical protein
MNFGMNRVAIFFALVSSALFTATPLTARSQSASATEGFSPPTTIVDSMNSKVIYIRPDERATVRKYIFDAYGPLPIAGAGVAAGVNQWNNSPPEWRQGAEGYAKRFGSDFGMAAISTTTRYGLSEALREDSSYYRCECRGLFPRLNHAVLSTVTARRGRDGHRVFSLSGIISPYAGSTVAVYGWYPERFGAKDALRLGNYSLLAFLGGNVALEFLYGGPHTLMSHMRGDNSAGSAGPRH